ncbi:MAG: DNA-3-methyladenine glycosylase I, partial [Gammaproteobacteria bacterium]|nr:DNA-3-methyladenine glycosylase I [Gammaproteobacteria bacterium]
MRCAWAERGELERDYHDNEWGIPQHDDRRLFEFLLLEGAQAGLSWVTILRKRAAYRAAFDDFDPARIASYDEERLETLMQNPGIIRNRLKIRSAIQNARAFLRVREEFGSFDAYLWRFVEGIPVTQVWPTMADLPPRSTVSDQLSRDLKSRGFGFVGSVICYSYMQAVGLINDHIAG